MGLLRKVALITMCFGAQASVAADQGFYFGLNAGQAKYDFHYKPPRLSASGPPIPGGFSQFNPFTPPYASLTAPTTAIGPVFSARPPIGSTNSLTPYAFSAMPLDAFWIPGRDDEANAFGGFVGYRIFPYAAVELAYTHLGTLHEYQPAIAITPTITTAAVESELETQGPALSLLALMPLTDRWDVYLRGGMLFADQKVSHTSVFPRQETTYGSDSLLFGVGTQFDFGAHWTVRLDFQRFDSVGEDNGIGETDIDVISLGVLFRL
jgi:OmpA-like transmembrane domain